MERFILEYALNWVSHQYDLLEQDRVKILELMEPVDNPNVARPVKIIAPKAPKKKKRNLSPEARERIAAAQRKRWSAHRGEVA